MHPDRVVVGADPGDGEAAEAVAAAYEPLGGQIVRTDVASAEMIKLASNAFLATKISFVNEIANVCEEVGADVGEIAQGGWASTSGSGRSSSKSGVGWGGSLFWQGHDCSEEARREQRLPLPVAERGDRRQRTPEAACHPQKLKGHLDSLAGPAGWRCSAWHSSRNTDDMRDAASLVLAARLGGRGGDRRRLRPDRPREGPVRSCPTSS